MLRMFLRLVVISVSLYLPSIADSSIVAFFIFLPTYIVLDLAVSHFLKKLNYKEKT
jgi:hypothetical protein